MAIGFLKVMLGTITSEIQLVIPCKRNIPGAVSSILARLLKGTFIIDFCTVLTHPVRVTVTDIFVD